MIQKIGLFIIALNLFPPSAFAAWTPPDHEVTTRIGPHRLHIEKMDNLVFYGSTRMMKDRILISRNGQDALGIIYPRWLDPIANHAHPCPEVAKAIFPRAPMTWTPMKTASATVCIPGKESESKIGRVGLILPKRKHALRSKVQSVLVLSLTPETGTADLRTQILNGVHYE